MSVEIKVVFNCPGKDRPQIIRRFREDVKSFSCLVQMISKCLDDYGSNYHFRRGDIKWQDEEGDYISICSDQDWALAIEKGVNKIIKLYVDCL